jgi:hypothetical protein
MEETTMATRPSLKILGLKNVALFDRIDKAGNGRIEETDLTAALHRAGLQIDSKGNTHQVGEQKQGRHHPWKKMDEDVLIVSIHKVDSFSDLLMTSEYRLVRLHFFHAYQTIDYHNY